MFEISTNLDVFEKYLSDVAEQQLPYAMARAINDTMKEVVDEVRDRVDVTFDRPTPYTRNAMAVVKRADKADLEARVAPRDNRSDAHYLRVQEDGGRRRQTKLERMLQSTVATAGILNSVLPGRNAKINQYGNWDVGERNRAVSGIKGWREVGYTANETARSARKARRMGRGTYFVPKHGLPPGIYRRTGDVLDIIAVFTPDAPDYEPRFGFVETAEKIAARQIAGNVERRLAEAITKAKWW